MKREDFEVGGRVTSRKLGPGVWEVQEVYEFGVAVTLNGIRHIREFDWFKPATPEDVKKWLTE